MKRKRFLSILLVFALCASLFPIAVRAADNGDDMNDSDFEFWCGHEGCTPNEPCLRPAASDASPVLTPQERLLQTHAPISSGAMDDGGKYIHYALAGGGFQSDVWDQDGNRTTYLHDINYSLIGVSMTFPDGQSQFTFSDGIFASGTVWDHRQRAAMDLENLGNGISKITFRDLDGRDDPFTTLLMSRFNLQYEDNPDGTRTWFTIDKLGRRIDVGTYRNENALVAGGLVVDTSKATNTESRKDKEGNDVTTYTFADKTVATHTLYSDGSYTVTITQADGTTQSCTYDAQGNAISQGTTVSRKQMDALVDAVKDSGADSILIDTAGTAAPSVLAAPAFNPDNWHSGENPYDVHTWGSLVETLYENGEKKTVNTFEDGRYHVVCYDKDGNVLFDATYDANGHPIRIDTDNMSASILNPGTAIAPGDTSGADLTSVTLPSSTISDIGTQTGASLTVATPVADVTIPNGGLNELAAQGGDVTVSAGKNGNTLELNVTADGKPVSKVPGGVTLTVPAQSAGTVATLVKEDGTRQLLPSAPHGSRIYIPLEGTAKVELGDNSRDFTDLPSSQWESEAVMWAASQGIIDGTDSDGYMTRAEAAAMIMRAIGYTSDMEAPSIFGIDWEHEISQQDLTVMLWRYAGSPGSTSNAFGSMTRSMLRQVLHNLEGNSSHSFDDAFNSLFFADPTWQEKQDARNWAEKLPIYADLTYGFDSRLATTGEACAALKAATTDSIIRDHDMAESITQYTKNNILLQAAQSMLAQANQVPQGVLQLLQ